MVIMVRRTIKRYISSNFFVYHPNQESCSKYKEWQSMLDFHVLTSTGKREVNDVTENRDLAIGSMTYIMKTRNPEVFCLMFFQVNVRPSTLFKSCSLMPVSLGFEKATGLRSMCHARLAHFGEPKKTGSTSLMRG